MMPSKVFAPATECYHRLAVRVTSLALVVSPFLPAVAEGTVSKASLAVYLGSVEPDDEGEQWTHIIGTPGRGVEELQERDMPRALACLTAAKPRRMMCEQPTLAYGGRPAGADFELVAGDIIQVANGRAEVVPGVVRSGDEIRVARIVRDILAGERPLAILSQAASRKIYDESGDVLGYQIFDIDPGSVFELAGIQEGDIVTELASTKVEGLLSAISAVKAASELDRFSFTVRRHGRTLSYSVRIE